MKGCKRKGWCRDRSSDSADHKGHKGHKGKGKGSKRCADGDSFGERKACAGGCGFMATWHPTHCCRRCEHGKGNHGPACEQVRCPAPPQPQKAPQEEMPEAMQCDEQEKASPPRFDLSFPVEVEDGRRLVISWNQGDDPLQVANSFAHENYIPMDEIPTIIAFVEHAMSSCVVKQLQAEGAAGSARSSEEESPAMRPAAEEKDAMAAEDDAARAEAEQKSASEEKRDEENKLALLACMGFGASAEDLACLLRGCGGDVQKVIEMCTFE